ncbi:MAG: hypothetical protein PF569_00580 [Candidatus Woesearchaeota archaeon]|jgi:prenyltransferase beta subunit|nr:hypothetical protein [Candidatus Woesearchaeota archaeon]
MVIDFLNKLQVLNLTYGNYGFRSSIKETDADVSSTYNVVYSLNLLNSPVPNKNGVIVYLKDHQNFDGGFGLQTNRKAEIFWTSTLMHTRRGLAALDLLGDIPDFYEEAINFIKKQQSVNRAFSDSVGDTPTISSTYNAVIALDLLKEVVPNTQGIKTFIINNQEINGGFKEHSLDTKEGIHTTFFALFTLNILNEDFDKEKPVSYVSEHFSSRLDGGFGNDPGLASTVKSTFNAISTLNLLGKSPINKTHAIDFLNSFKNSDGGFGDNGISNVETTYRAVLALNLLGENINNPTKTIEYVKSLQNVDGGFGFAKDYISRGSYTYRALRALEILGSEPNNKIKAISFLKLLQNSDGGFGNYIGESDSDLGSSYRAIRALNILNENPNNVNFAKKFIFDSLNLDGGFKRSPDEIVFPGNHSKTIFTYDAILSLFYLEDTSINYETTIKYLKDLRNPDLGFAPQKDFTSEISSTFTSLWTYYYILNNELNIKPKLKFSKVERIIDENSNAKSIFSTRYYDNESQMPEYVHLVLNNEKYLMKFEDDNLKGNLFTYTSDLPIGAYEYYFETTDGINFIKSNKKYFNISALGEIPRLNLNVSSNEGDESTIFGFNVNFDKVNFNDIEYVKIKFNDYDWIDMNKTNSSYVYETNLKSGIYNYKVKAYDGINILSSDKYQLYVYGQDVNKPSWEIFEKINSLVLSAYNKRIKFEDVEKTIIEGNLIWKVNLNNDFAYVDYKGNNFYEITKNSNSNILYYIIGGVLLTLIILATFLLKKKGN